MSTELLWLLLPWSLAFGFLGRLRACPLLPNRIDRVKVSVIVPARNEQARLPPLLASLQIQDYADFEVVVVDDNSDDRTADLARAAGATTLTLTELADGWLGKPYACWIGAQRARGDPIRNLSRAACDASSPPMCATVAWCRSSPIIGWSRRMSGSPPSFSSS
jgi:4,4'-diaponeurosporenoate glycosyltransferase